MQGRCGLPHAHPQHHEQGGRLRQSGLQPRNPCPAEERREGNVRHTQRQAIRDARHHRAHRRQRRARRIQRIIRTINRMYLCPHRRLGGRHCGQPAQGRKKQKRRDAVWRCDLQRQRRQGGTLYHELQPEKNSAGVLTGRYRLYGGLTQRARRHHQGRRQAGECDGQLRGTKIYRDPWQQLRCGQLRHVRQGLRPPPHCGLADGAGSGDGRCAGSESIGTDRSGFPESQGRRDHPGERGGAVQQNQR